MFNFTPPLCQLNDHKIIRYLRRCVRRMEGFFHSYNSYTNIPRITSYFVKFKDFHSPNKRSRVICVFNQFNNSIKLDSNRPIEEKVNIKDKIMNNINISFIYIRSKWWKFSLIETQSIQLIITRLSNYIIFTTLS